jgi:hypothetical protein
LIAYFANTGWKHAAISRYFQVPEREIDAVLERMAAVDTA